MNRKLILASLLSLAICAPIIVSNAQEAADRGADSALEREMNEVSIAIIESRSQAVAMSQLSAEAKQSIKLLYDEALNNVKLSEARWKQTTEFEQIVQQAPQMLKTIQTELAKPPAELEPEVPATATLQDLERLQGRVESEFKAVQAEASRLRTEVTVRSQKRATLLDLIAQQEQILKTNDQQLSVVVPDQDAELKLAQRTRLLALRKLTLAEIRAAETEISSYDARRELLSARTDYNARRVLQLEKLLNSWRELVSDRRKLEAEKARQAAEDLRRKAIFQLPALKAIAERNQQLAALRTGAEGMTAKLENIDSRVLQLTQRLDNMRQRYQSARRKVEAAGLTNAMGVFLRKQYDNLPTARLLYQDNKQRQDIISDIQYRTILIEEERSEFGDVERLVREELARSNTAPESGERISLEAAARELYTARRSLLDALIQDYDRYLNKLLELNNLNNRLIKVTNNYQTFIESHILWVRSVTGPSLPDYEDAGAALAWFTDSKTWSNAAQKVPAALATNWLETILATLGLLILAFVVLRARSIMDRVSTPLDNPEQDRFRFTLMACLVTSLAAAFWPALLYATAWALTLPAGQAPAVLVVAATLKELAVLLFAFELIRVSVADSGLAERHFLADPENSQQLRRKLTVFVPIWAIFNFIVISTELQVQSNLWSDSLGRIAFIFSQLWLAFFLYRSYQPAVDFTSSVLKVDNLGWFAGIRKGVLVACLAVPILLLLLSIRGYHYSAIRLENRYLTTLWFIIGLLLANGLYLRWLRLVAQRTLSEQAVATPKAEETIAGLGIKKETLPETPIELTKSSPLTESSVTTSSQSALESSQSKASQSSESLTESAEKSESAEQAKPEIGVTPEEDKKLALVAQTEAEEGSEPTLKSGEPLSNSESSVALKAVAESDAKTEEALTPKTEAEATAAETGGPILNEQAELVNVYAQARELLSSFTLLALLFGLYLIWASTLPALKKLDHIQVWPLTTVSESSPAKAKRASGSSDSVQTMPKPGLTPSVKSSTSEVESTETYVITLSQLLLAIVFLIATIIAGNNFPALIDIVILQKLPFDSGGRYAIKALSSYLIYIVGISMTLGTVGISWQSLQWLAAALTFGLAFGLQEVFANFVSGLILLFERPIRVGDIVTVGDLSGVVTRIQIRATTVRNFDRKELIIPNKSFVTEKVLNWGLTDTILRIVIPVGIAYGSDTKKARELLLNIAKSHPDVLNTPSPSSLFLGYGDSTLNFELRVFVPSVGRIASTKNDILESIGEAFKEHNIEIAFPQRDVNLRVDQTLAELIREVRQKKK